MEELQAVACANCGAPLTVPGEVRFVTCNHCHSTLKIKHTESVTYSAKIAQMDVRTERIESKVDLLRLERDLDACDQEWDRKKLEFMSVDENGGKTEPTVQHAFETSGVLAVVGLGMLLLPTLLDAGPVVSRCFGAGLILVACWIGITGLLKVRLYDEAKGFYLGRRCRLISQLEQARKSSSDEVPITTSERQTS